MIKLIASDMDGTLLNKESKISEKNEKAIKAIQQKGVQFMMATGREYDIVKPLLEEYQLRCKCILMNGSEIRDEEGNILQTVNVNKNLIHDIIQISDKYNLAVEIFADKGIFTTNSKEKSLEANARRIQGFRPEYSYEECIEITKKHFRFVEQQYITNLSDFLSSEVQIRRISSFHHNLDIVEQAKAEIKEKIKGISVLSFFPDNIEMTDESATKGVILKKYIKELGILPEEVIVMGDSYNDISLFEEFENSYAVSNADADVMKLANHIVGSNDEDGVAQVINSLL